jgi:hypothetical protein
LLILRIAAIHGIERDLVRFTANTNDLGRMSEWILSTFTREAAPPRDATAEWGSFGEGVETSSWRSHEFIATESNREHWTADFWALFPADEDSFIELVRTTGISASVTLDFEPEAVVQPEYGGVAANKLSRLLLSDQTSSYLDRLYGPRDTNVDEAALALFKRDLAAWESEYRVAADLCALRLPQPPGGFVWIPDMGGVIMTREAGGWNAPEHLTYRLWRRDLGYMPTSE